MSILSDKEIIRLCTPPTFVTITNVPPRSIGLNYMTPTPVESFTYLDEEILKQKIEDNTKADHSMITMQHIVGLVGYRPLTEQELSEFRPMISPFVDHQVKLDEAGKRILSKGLSSFGYDVSLTGDFRIFTNINTTLVDPLDFNPKCLHTHQGDYAIIPPNSYLLGTTNEWFDIPNDVMVLCVGKSSLARCSAIVNCTPIEPGFRGNVVIEIANASPSPLKIYANMGVAQFLFFRGSEPCAVSYADRGGKYQNQTGVQLALT